MVFIIFWQDSSILLPFPLSHWRHISSTPVMVKAVPAGASNRVGPTMSDGLDLRGERWWDGSFVVFFCCCFFFKSCAAHRCVSISLLIIQWQQFRFKLQRSHTETYDNAIFLWLHTTSPSRTTFSPLTMKIPLGMSPYFFPTWMRSIVRCNTRFAWTNKQSVE
jgi:hypothetical protein